MAVAFVPFHWDIRTCSFLKWIKPIVGTYSVSLLTCSDRTHSFWHFCVVFRNLECKYLVQVLLLYFYICWFEVIIQNSQLYSSCATRRIYVLCSRRNDNNVFIYKNFERKNMKWTIAIFFCLKMASIYSRILLVYAKTTPLDFLKTELI